MFQFSIDCLFYKYSQYTTFIIYVIFAVFVGCQKGVHISVKLLTRARMLCVIVKTILGSIFFARHLWCGTGKIGRGIESVVYEAVSRR